MTTPSETPVPGSGADWLKHAASDLRVARLALADPDVLRNQVAFHAQQAAEKSIKAVLVHRALRFPGTHDLEALVEMVRLAGLQWPESLHAELLTPFAVESRYPGVFGQISSAEADSAIQTAEAVLDWADHVLESGSTE